MPEPFLSRPFHEPDTSFGRVQCISDICSGAIPPPQREDLASGRLTNGHSVISSGSSLLRSSRRTCGTSPARTFPAKRRSRPS